MVQLPDAEMAGDNGRQDKQNSQQYMQVVIYILMMYYVMCHI